MNTRSLTLLGSALAAFVIGLLVLSAPRSFAQEGPGLQAVAGSGFSYQGRLNDKGVPANGSYDLAFRLYATRQGGAPIATELRFDNYQVMNGLFLVTLDFNGEYFTGEGRWLEVSVRAGDSAGDYTTLRPRQELMPTPYALYAGKAGTVEWSKISGIPADITDGDNDTRYTAGAGLRLDGTSFSVDPKYRLPETCAAGQYPRYNGTVWVCAQLNDTGTPTNYAYRIVVAKSGGNYSSIQAALDSINDNSVDIRYLIWVAPGIYNERVVMKPWVDIEGSGELATEIRAEGSNNSFTGTVVAANNAELRSLTVKSSGGPGFQYAVALYNPANLARFKHVSAEAYGAPRSYGLYNYGLPNAYIFPVIDYITVKAYDGNENIGIFNHYAAPKLSYLASYAYNGALNYGVYNLGASGAPVEPQFSYLESYAYDGGRNYAFYNVYANPTFDYVSAYAYDGQSSYGVYNEYASPRFGHSQISARGTGSYGVYNFSPNNSYDRYSVWLDNTLIAGDTGTIYNTAKFITYVGGSKLAGGAVQNQGGTLKCAGVYDDAYNFYTNSCGGGDDYDSEGYGDPSRGEDN